MSQIFNGSSNGVAPKKCPKFISVLNEKPVMPDGPPKCTWHKDADPKSSPHRKVEWLVPVPTYNNLNLTIFFLSRRSPKQVLPNVLQAVGNTPLVKLNKIPQSFGLECDVCKYRDPLSQIYTKIFVNGHFYYTINFWPNAK